MIGLAWFIIMGTFVGWLLMAAWTQYATAQREAAIKAEMRREWRRHSAEAVAVANSHGSIYDQMVREFGDPA